MDCDIDTINGLDMGHGAPHQAFLYREPDLDPIPFQDQRRVQGNGFFLSRWLGRQQRLGIGMLRGLEQGGGMARFHNLPLLHDTNPVRNAPHDPQIMGDEQHRHAGFLLQIFQQFQNLRLDRDIQRGGWFIGD